MREHEFRELTEDEFNTYSASKDETQYYICLGYYRGYIIEAEHFTNYNEYLEAWGQRIYSLTGEELISECISDSYPALKGVDDADSGDDAFGKGMVIIDWLLSV